MINTDLKTVVRRIWVFCEIFCVFNSQEHPGMLAPMFDYAQILMKVPDRAEDAHAVWTGILAIVELVADKYRKQGDLVSAVICLESGIQATEGILGERSQSVKRMSQKAESLESALDGDEAGKVGLSTISVLVCMRHLANNNQAT